MPLLEISIHHNAIPNCSHTTKCRSERVRIKGVAILCEKFGILNSCPTNISCISQWAKNCIFRIPTLNGSTISILLFLLYNHDWWKVRELCKSIQCHLPCKNQLLWERCVVDYIH